MTEVLGRKSISKVPHPSYSLDLASCDFFFYSTDKKDLKGRHFGNKILGMKVFGATLKRLKINDLRSGNGDVISV